MPVPPKEIVFQQAARLESIIPFSTVRKLHTIFSPPWSTPPVTLTLHRVLPRQLNRSRSSFHALNLFYIGFKGIQIFAKTFRKTLSQKLRLLADILNII